MIPSINWTLFPLELLITLTLVVLVIMDVLLPKTTQKDWLGYVSLGANALLLGFWTTQRGVIGNTFNGMFVEDPLSWFFKAFLLTTMLFIFVMTHKFFAGQKNLSMPHIPSPAGARDFTNINNRRNEFYLLLWLALIGMCLIASSADFLTLFIALETLTISLYVLTAYMKSDKFSLEAGMKYLILGALSSGFFLYGMSFLYGVTHSTRFDVIQQYVNSQPMSPIMLFAMVLVFAAVGFKIAAVPFHMWVPDVYQGAPIPVTALLSVGSKAAGFVILLRLFSVGGIFAAWHGQWSVVLAVLSAITMTYGNLVAMFQTNIKRLLGYSSISHAGYLLMGAAAGTMLGAGAMNFYLVGYLFTNLAAFLVILLFSIAAKSEEISDYAGLAQRSGILAGTMLLALASLAGMPPLAGFFGKFALLIAVIKNGFLWLALVASVNIVISLYYYLMIAKRIYVDGPRTNSPIPVSVPMRIILIVNMIAIVGIGIFQGPLFNAAITAINGM